MLKHMTKLLAGTAALALTAGASFAADLPSRRAPAPYIAVPVFTWTGFYAGVNAGYGFSDTNNSSFNFGNSATVPVAGGGFAPVNAPAAAGIFTNNRSQDGFVGGGQVGYNYQFGAGSGIVVGLEGDIQYTDFGSGRNNGIAAFGNGEFGATPTVVSSPGLGIGAANAGRGNVFLFGNGFNNNRGSDFYGSIRGRVGYAFDRVLVYATGGVAFFGDDRNNNSFFAAPTAGFFTTAAGAATGAGVVGTFNNRRDDIGFLVGGGVEYAFTNSITARIEGFYVERDSKTNRGGNQVIGVSNTGAAIQIPGGGFGSGNNDSFGVVRAGLNYKFNLF